MGEFHSPLGASGAARWLACPPSFGLIQRSGTKDEESEHAALGTAAHKLAEMCLESGKDAWEYLGQTINGFVVGNEKEQIEPDPVQVYLDYVRPIAEVADHFAVELRLGQKWKPHPLYGGTADFVAVVHAAEDGIEIVDYKHGAGLGVDPVGNPQLQYYAIGAFKEMAGYLPDTAAVHLTIVQPRYADGRPVKTWTITVGELRAWSRDVMVPGMLAAEKAEGEYTPGEHCRFCPAILACPKQKADLQALNREDTDNMTDDELDALFPTFATVKMFMRAAEAKLQARLMEGAAFHQVKLVSKRAAARIWKEGVEEKMVAELGDDAYNKKLLSPAEAEKLSTKWKAFVAENAFLPPATGYNLASATDSAPAANPVADITSQFAHYQTTGE
jgi:hypothetical protein